MTRPLKPILLALSLILLTACSQSPVTKTESIPVYAPDSMMQNITEPAYTGTTNRDHLNYTIALRAALRQANAQLEALRAWKVDQLKTHLPD